MSNNAAKALNELAVARKNLANLNAKVGNTLKKAGVVGEEARATVKKLDNAEQLIQKVKNETREKTLKAMRERKNAYNHKLSAFMKARDPSKRYTQAENNALRNRAGHAVYGKQQTYWNSTKHRAYEWDRMAGGRRRGSRKDRRRRMTRRR